MNFGGLRKLSTLDFPTKLCATVFTKGCNFRCPFCHNASLAFGDGENISETEFFDFLKKRKGLLDAVSALIKEFPYADCYVNVPVDEEEYMYGETEIDLLRYLKDICPDCIHMH